MEMVILPALLFIPKLTSHNCGEGFGQQARPASGFPAQGFDGCAVANNTGLHPSKSYSE